MHPIPSSARLNRSFGLTDRAASIPSLTGPVVDRFRKRSDSEYQRVPGSAMLGINHSVSATTSPYLRRHPMAMRKRSSSADSTRHLDDLESITERTTSTASSTQVNESSINTSVDSLSSQIRHDSAAVHVRRSSSVPCKSGNRDSSSSNDSGVSTGSLKHRGADFAEFELPLTTALSSKRHYHAINQRLHSSQDCIHATLPRRSKSSDPLRELTFQFPKVTVPAKSSSAEAELPICPNKREPKGNF
ncbi:hypothetical protein AAG570_002135 [Ranatra chinensis]|uniref:Uncharacterized protein n=1 Tax=Ranatra chinensis TaxID=642074 RepID=A0ABD0Y729_9HEMI